jgi:hypothetical protein
MVMSKMERISPDIKGLLSSRSYMLKMLVEKVFTRKEFVGKGKRANAYNATIAEVKREMRQLQPDDEEVDAEDNLELYQEIFLEAARAYQASFGNLMEIPGKLMNSKDYL